LYPENSILTMWSGTLWQGKRQQTGGHHLSWMLDAWNVILIE
jgi:hypothetical protein